MKLTVTKNGTGKKPLQSWKSPSDPSDGRFTAGIDTFTLPQLVVWDGNRTRWRSGPWNGNILIGVHFDFKDFINAQLVISSDKEGTVTAVYFYPNESLLSTYMLSIDGNLSQIWWNEIKRKWEIEWQVPTTECDVFGKCGGFGTCNPRRPTMCQCLKGFQPRNKTEWSKGNWSDGCLRTTRLQCDMGKGEDDRFLRMKMMKVPENAEWRLGLNQDACRKQCFKNCSCLAYAYDAGVGCMTWSTSLIDIQEFSVGGVDLYLRLAHSELGTNNKKKVTAAVIGSFIGMAVSAVLFYFLWRQKAHQQDAKKKMKVDNYKKNNMNFEEIPLFKFETLAAATNNFNESNKLGQGGFGSVYKGKLQDGQEIAVKRLSGFSTQGLEEFMNEVKLISKLQHRNLVKLLGCSVEGKEKMLVYEYMPNKSLDAFLFGNQKDLDWDTRFNIIEGICRGLQYLHKDSRLRIIHRDLKASNILLDEGLNPKISDFGMARIFGGDQDEADTRRVVGTYGYMSPEYAMEGLFSEKSDVFSFGVLLLEILSGKRNSGFSDDEDSLSLIENAWKLWEEKNIMSLTDPTISEPPHEQVIIRCVQIGLLCVQEFAKDRPDVPTVISMLDGEILDLPNPKRPGYVHINRNISYSQQKSSINHISITEIRGRQTNRNIVAEAHLLDTGNLVLVGLEGKNLWQSFNHPTDTALPNMKITVTKSSDGRKMLQAWNGPSDPSYGRFSVGIDSFAFPQLVIFDGDQPYWRSGPWNGHIFTGITNNETDDFNDAGFNLENDRQGTISLTYSYTNQSVLSNYGLSYQGTLTQRWWDENEKRWKVAWEAPQTECDLYGKCGAFGSCNLQNSPICRCLKGFKPKNKFEWNKGKWSSGCTRRKPLQCVRGSGKEDGFFRVKAVKVPDNSDWLIGLDEDECRNQCLKNCSCLAYVYDSGAGCMSWNRDLIDTEELSAGGVDLYLRLAHSELGNNRKTVAAIAATGSLATIVVVSLILILRKRQTLKQGKKLQKKQRVSDALRIDNIHNNHDQIEEVPLFDFKRVVMATNNFQDTNKLGKGGFGPVYKGKLEDGQEIAVKKLSKASGQGVEEFMNEVLVISKLQHRNLVRLLGCCVEGKEKMLIYEYMPNKSLDYLLFDPMKQDLLPWKKRYNIIQGICQGLLYLHRDSRLKIIHRDLKASNILLDKNLNPKISDFGMARIFGGKQEQDDTRRIVGTYGYMSPEYAMEGRFSEKSDVFSFGVLLLEIVSGKRNSLFWYEESSLSLLGYAYKLWKENHVLSFIDPKIAETCFLGEVQKCIQVGLLCVQESAKDRPNMSTVISLLHKEDANLPQPNQPGFTHSQKSKNVGSSSEQSQQTSSTNYVSVTALSAR
uniref:non-specific serine/threonine protein kinase n=1 Tax=Chenopodium quinoa TaxID=63459 RepID=A0A803LL19_CHEQI